MKSTFKTIAVVFAAAACGLALTGCTGEAVATSDMVAIVVGNGRVDAEVKNVVYPGDQVGYASATENVFYLPVNTRNYVVGKADSGVIVDRNAPAVGRTKEGTPVNVWLGSAWTLNQDYKVLTEKMWPFCLKYNCAAAQASQRNEQSGISEGWTKMLNENFADAYNATVRKVMPQFSDTVWKDEADWDKLAAALSAEFPRQMALKTNYSEDLFCGAGDLSTWNGTKPGPDGKFTCGPITFNVTAVESQNNNQQQANADANAAKEQKQANADILDAATAKYGSAERAGQVLGQIDVINACREAGTSCVVSVGGAAVSVAAPAAK